jgi:thiamine-phosphate pyrophosphorylase
MPAEGAMARLDPRTLRLYVVTSGTSAAGRTHRAVASAAVRGGATAVQLRGPELGDDELMPLAASLIETCAEAGVPLLVNDRIEVAVSVGAAGAHVGQEDDPATARGRLGSDRILGVSVRNAEDVWVAEMAGADYLGVTVWATDTKPGAVPVGLEGIRDVAAATALPVVGIGGIHAGNAREVLEAGAAGIAVIGAVAEAEDPVGAVRELRAMVDAISEEKR